VIRTPFRDHVQRRLAAKGVASEVYYPTPLPYQPAFEELGYRLGQFPVAEKMSRESLALPVHAELSEEDIRRVADLVVQACNDASNSPSARL
jgi:dTDP-4-amino-4,6-dideoxygalactose transaminase